MLTDFRKDMYSQYVTRFTASNLSSSPKIATAYHRWCDVKFKPFLDRLSKHSRIVELGCGPGHMLTYLLGQGFVNVMGIDISDEQIDIARRAGLPAQTEDAFAFLENTSQMFDAIIAIDFLEHFTKLEARNLMLLAASRMHAGGVLITQTPNGACLMPGQVIYGDLTHCTIYTDQSLRQLMLHSGFDNCRFYEAGPVPNSFAGRIRVALWHLLRLVANLIRTIEAGKCQSVWTENMICIARKAGCGNSLQSTGAQEAYQNGHL